MSPKAHPMRPDQRGLLIKLRRIHQQSQKALSLAIDEKYDTLPNIFEEIERDVRNAFYNVATLTHPKKQKKP